MGSFQRVFFLSTTQKYVGKTPCFNSFGESGKCVAEWREIPVKRVNQRVKAGSLVLIQNTLAVNSWFTSCNNWDL
jgi:hypothetical protein